MRKPPAFQFYPKDWRSSATVRQMSRAEKGDLIEMLAASWDQDPPGSLPLPVQLAAKSAGLDPRVVRSLITKFPKLWVEIDGRLVNPKLRAQWEELQQRQQKLSDAGKRGNENRWKKSSGAESGGESQGDSGGNRSASASAFASASAPASVNQGEANRPPSITENYATLLDKYPTKRDEIQKLVNVHIMCLRAERFDHGDNINFQEGFESFCNSWRSLALDWRDREPAWAYVVHLEEIMPPVRRSDQRSASQQSEGI